MRLTRTAVTAGLLVVEAGIAGLGVLFHYGLTSEYGDITDSVFEGFASGFSTGTGMVALILVGLPAVVAAMVSSKRWVRLAAGAIPVLMLGAMLASPPSR